MKGGLPSPKDSPPHPQLKASLQKEEVLKTAEYWRQLCPELHVQSKKYQKTAVNVAKKIPKELLDTYKRQMDEDGYFHVPETLFSDFLGSQFFDTFGKCIIRLMQYGWQPTFINLYDEAWVIVNFFSAVMAEVTGNRPNMDMLSWYIDPESSGGFSPHRDRQPADSPSSFYKDTGMPKYATCWVAITDAVPDNSCLYVIPRWQDPGYYEGDDDESELTPLQIALPNKEDYQTIKALPAQKGSVLMFSHRIIHWGSKGRKGYHTPRIAFSFANSSDDFEPAYFDRKHLPFPEVSLRFALSCGQMISYYDRFQFSVAELQIFHNFFKSEGKHFHATYVQKVLNEYVIALKGKASTPSFSTPSPVLEGASKKTEKSDKRKKAQKRKAEESEKKAVKKTDASSKKEEKKQDKKTKKPAKKSDSKKAGSKNVPSAVQNEPNFDDDEEEAALDAALEAMLEGHLQGFGDDFEDDFDTLGEDIFTEPKKKKQKTK